LRHYVRLVCIVAKRCILERKLLLTAYEKSIGTKVIDLDRCLEVVSMSCQPLRYIRQSPLNVSEIVRDRGLVAKDHW